MSEIEVLHAENEHLRNAWRRADKEATDALRHVAILQEALARKPYQSDLDDADLRVEAAEATLSRLREVLAGHPECGVHPDDDPITCGWKRAVYDLRAVLADS